MASHERSARRRALSGLLGWVAATGWEARQAANRRRTRQLRLSVDERDTCAGELAEQYALGRLDEAELDRRVDLLHRAVTRADLEPVFAGLPAPRLYAPTVRPVRWRRLVFAAAVWLAAPFVLLGLIMLAAGHEVVAVVLGLPPLVWVLLWWRWAATDRPARAISRRRT